MGPERAGGETGTVRCPLCQGTACRSLFTLRSFAIVECTACRFRFVGNPLSPEQVASYYEESYFRGNGEAFRYQDYDAQEADKRRTFTRRLEVIEGVVGRRGRVLDVGCATGIFVQAAVARGWDAYGIDLSAYAVDVANRAAPGRCFQAMPDEAPFEPGSFDVVTLFDCVEHVATPVDCLRACARLVRPEGLLVIETPDVGSLMSKLMRSRWPYYRPPEHLVYFNRQTLTQALARVGCRPLRVRPSVKTVTLEYVRQETQASNPALSRMLGLTRGWLPGLGRIPFQLPTGSLWVIAQKERAQDAAPSRHD